MRIIYIQHITKIDLFYRRQLTLALLLVPVNIHHTKNFANIFSLKQEISKIKQSNTQLVTKIVTKWEELNTYLPPTTDET